METPTFIENYQTEEYDLCDRIIKRLEYYLDETDKIRPRAYMKGSETNNGSMHRTDFSVNFVAQDDPMNSEIFSLLNHYVSDYAEKYTGYASSPCISNSIKVQKTPPKGGFHTWHNEHGSQRNDSYRTLTWTLYLNDIPDGEGETEFLEYGVKVQPKKGLLCFFPAAWTHMHRGNPVYSQNKYIATGWYYLT